MNEGHYIEYMKNNWIKLIKRITLDKKRKDCVKGGLSPAKKFFFIYFNGSPSKMMKNAFYFMLKALVVLSIFRFLS